jgi:hypothetical protein
LDIKFIEIGFVFGRMYSVPESLFKRRKNKSYAATMVARREGKGEEQEQVAAR